MSEYRDYGTVGSLGAAPSAVDSTRYTQVYHATHEGEQRLSLARRSFISFTFGGKHIEDFNLIATTSGDRMERAAYAPFEDNTSTNENLSGQQYWGTHYQAHFISFTLATDGMDQRQLEDFRYWFRAGETRELILAEHPNRGILARVSDPPQFSLLPFESNTTITISSVQYPVKTTLYKGEITLNLVMDEPHWYSIQNILGTQRGDRYVDLVEENGQEISIFASVDMLKILYEDGIPLGSMIQNNMLLGNETYAKVEDDISSCIWDPEATQVTNVENLVGGGACIDGTENGVTYKGIIAGAIVGADGNGIVDFPANTPAYFYYSGTAPAPVIIRFEFTPVIDNTSCYITTPCNSHNDNKKYNTITIQGETIQEFKYTTPNIMTSYNKAIEIITKQYGNTVNTIMESLRDNVRHSRVREWAIKVINEAGNNNKSTLLTNMANFWRDNNSYVSPVKFEFNSENGEAIGSFCYRKITASGVEFVEDQKEDIGDMLVTNHLLITDRNHPNENGRIVAWENTIAGKSYSHKITHDSAATLHNFILIYKNLYL